MLLQVDGLRKTFGRRVAVDGVGFSLDVGEIVGFLGPNGAGKTTTMRMIAGYLEPDEGAAKIFNIDVARERRRAQERLGYLPEGAPLYGEMTPWSFLRFVAETRGMAQAKPRATPCAAPPRTRAWATASTVRSRRSPRAIAAASASPSALLHDPLLLVLDEPTDGLDPNQRHAVRDLIRKPRRGARPHPLHPQPGGSRSGVHPRHRHRSGAHRRRPDAGGADREQHGSLERAFEALTRGEERA